MELQWVLVLWAVLEPANAIDTNFMDILTLDDLPLTKSLGYSYGKTPHNTLEDARLNHEYIEQYQEILKASHETFDSVNGDDQKLEKKEGRRQRHAHQVYSPVRHRRARSEALRRDKLNSQSLRSHMEHTRQSSTEEHSLETNV